MVTVKKYLYLCYLFFSLLTLSLNCSCQTQEVIRDSVHFFSGKLIDSQTGEPVQFAHVLNETQSYAMISDTIGYFSIPVHLHDLLVATAIGYYNLPLYISDSIYTLNRFHTFRMIPKIYPIKEVNVSVLGTYDQFKYKFLHLDIPNPENKINPSVLNDIMLGIDTTGVVRPATIMSPITAIYNLVSKEGKSARKLKKIEEEEKFLKQVEYKYNNDMLERITGLKGIELYEFISFCNFNRKFLLEASEYEIIEAVLEKLDEYRKMYPED
jgi:hypothetical protein